MRRTIWGIGAILALAGWSCSGKTAGNAGNCTGNSDCGAGQVCDNGTCVTLCRSDTECPTGQVCNSAGTCEPGQRNSPTVSGVDGDDQTTVCPDAGGTHCIANGLVVTGTNLAGAAFTLTPNAGGTAIMLSVRQGSTADRALVDFPDVNNVVEGVYTLTAANQSGSVDQAVQLIQGPPGPPGPNLSGDQLVDLINAGSTAIQFGHLAGVAPLSHTHTASQVVGALDVSQLPAHDHLSRGMVVNTVMAQTRTQTLYTAPNSGTGTKLTPLDLTITPQKAGNRVILEWVINGESNENVVFLAQRDGLVLPNATNTGGNRWAGIATSSYDQNENSTQHNTVVRIIDMDCLSTATTYSVHVRSSNNNAYTYYLNRTVGSLGTDSYEATLSTGVATEIYW